MSAKQQVIDCDVHCAIPSIDAIAPYLSEHWQDYYREIGSPLPPVTQTYPVWSTTVATPGTISLDAVRRDVLGKADYAILHCYFAVEGVSHPYLAPELATAANRWMEATWLDQEARLFGSVVIAPQFAAAAVEEINRVGDDPRFVQVLLPARAWEPYGNERYWPIWEAAAEKGLSLAITFGGATSTPPTPVNWMASFFEDHAVSAQQFQTHLTSLIVAGVFDRFPDLKVTVAESGWTWLPAWLWNIDQNWRGLRREVPWLDDLPSAYVRRHVRFTTNPVDAPADPVHLRRVIDQLGSSELLMFGSDYPHSYDFPAEELLEQLSPDETARVLWSNAASHYDLDRRLQARASTAR